MATSIKHPTRINHLRSESSGPDCLAKAGLRSRRRRLDVTCAAGNRDLFFVYQLESLTPPSPGDYINGEVLHLLRCAALSKHITAPHRG